MRRGLDLEASPQLKQATEVNRLELRKEAAGLDLRFLPSDVARTVRE